MKIRSFPWYLPLAIAIALNIFIDVGFRTGIIWYGLEKHGFDIEQPYFPICGFYITLMGASGKIILSLTAVFLLIAILLNKIALRNVVVIALSIMTFWIGAFYETTQRKYCTAEPLHISSLGA